MENNDLQAVWSSSWCNVINWFLMESFNVARVNPIMRTERFSSGLQVVPANSLCVKWQTFHQLTDSVFHEFANAIFFIRSSLSLGMILIFAQIRSFHHIGDVTIARENNFR